MDLPITTGSQPIRTEGTDTGSPSATSGFCAESAAEPCQNRRMRERQRGGAPADRGYPNVPLVRRWEDDVLPAWLLPTGGENRLPVAAAIVIAAVLQLLLPQRFTLVHPKWLLPSAEFALLISLTVINPVRLTRHTPAARYLSLLLVAVISLDNGASAVLLDSRLIRGTAGNQAAPLLTSAAAIYLTNLIAFGIWYWELDRGGPFARAAAHSPYPDFLFPQMTQHHLARKDWQPLFADYLYVSFTNATAFSPTDTLPLTRWAKLLMAVQSAIALSTTALVIARGRHPQVAHPGRTRAAGRLRSRTLVRSGPPLRLEPVGSCPDRCVAGAIV
jgi:hypothetical protein